MSAALLLCSAFFLAWAITLIFERRSARLGLLQSPNARSAHVRPTPTGGGVSIALVGILGFALAASQGEMRYAGAAAIAAAFAILGFVDDRYDLSPALRFPIQAALIAALLVLAGPLPTLAIGPLQLSGLPLTAVLVVAALWWINLFNFMDGIDGIAATQAILILVGAFAVSSTSGQAFVLSSGVIIAATGGFLIRNWPPARIFMGDVGSNYLAVAILAVALFGLRDGEHTYPGWLILISVFVADATLTLVRRVLRGEKPWRSHNTHAYQHLARKFGHLKVTLLYAAITLFWSVPLAVFAQHRTSSAWMIAIAAYIPMIALAYIAGAGTRARRTLEG